MIKFEIYLFIKSQNKNNGQSSADISYVALTYQLYCTYPSKGSSAQESMHITTLILFFSTSGSRHVHTADKSVGVAGLLVNNKLK